MAKIKLECEFDLFGGDFSGVPEDKLHWAVYEFLNDYFATEYKDVTITDYFIPVEFYKERNSN